MLEIDVDVRRLAALGGDETREQQIVFRRIDGGDAEHVADRRIGGGAAPLAQDPLLAREVDDVVDGEKIGRVIELLISASSCAMRSRTFCGTPCG